jgi:drug/metabolite transporter (DMT)-like permease
MPFALHGSIQFTGEIAALTAALFWAVSSILFKKLGKTIPPIEMNLLKGTLAIVLFFVTSLVLKEKTADLSLQAVLMLAVSGALGIGYGDTVYFEALNILGARRTLLITILAPVFTAILAWIFLRENLALIGWLGIVVTMAGIAWVITEQKNGDAENKKLLWRGVFYGFLAALTQAIGAVISRWALTETTVSALQSAMIRLVAGVVFLLVWIVVKRVKIAQWVKPASSVNLWGTVLVVVIIGTYLAIWLQQIAFQFTRVGIAQTLLATAPLFVLPISAIQHEKLSIRAVAGVLLAVSGIALLFLVG